MTTLQQIIDKHSLTTHVHPTGGMVVTAPIGTEARKELFNLSDYKVHNSTGDTLFMGTRSFQHVGGVPYGN